LPTAETRRDWAIEKSKWLAHEKMDLAVGGPRVVRKPLTEAVADYFKGAENRLRDNTLALYRAASELLLAWAKKEGIATTDALTATKLPSFRDYLLARKKAAIKKGGKRGQRKTTIDKLKPHTINWQLRSVKTLLNDLRIRGIVPLSSDAIGDGLKPATVPREAPDFLKPVECAALLTAALEHDAETVITREDEQEFRRLAAERGITRKALAEMQPKGTTPRYSAIAPFVAVTLLTGMRVSEVLTLKWSAVDLDAMDHDGKVVGEIRLRATDTKTKYARVISLDVCPSLLALLAALRERKGNNVYVFGGKSPMTSALALASRKRLLARKDVPKNFCWQVLRSTCATVQCNAPGLFGTAAAFVSAKRLGHSITVSEKHYAGLFAVSREARTLEAAMDVEEHMTAVSAMARGEEVDLDALKSKTRDEEHWPVPGE